MTEADAELVDVVDETGQPVGVVTRREMRARRLPHRTSYVLVFNRRGELFIHQRTLTQPQADCAVLALLLSEHGCLTALRGGEVTTWQLS